MVVINISYYEKLKTYAILVRKLLEHNSNKLDYSILNKEEKVFIIEFGRNARTIFRPKTKNK